MIRLLLLRHAKAEPLEGHASDHDRPLSPEGVTAAREVGAWLRGHGLIPDLVLCSTARRTRETWSLAAEGGGISGVDTRFVARLYETSVSMMLDVVREAAQPHGTVLVVGHEPTMSHAVLHLSGRRPMAFRPGTVALIEWTVGTPASPFDPGSASLVFVRAPGESIGREDRLGKAGRGLR